MTIQRTRRRPDTCDCEFSYTWDDTQLPNPTHTIFDFTRICADHSAEPNLTNRFNIVTEENKRKNDALENIIANGPTALYDTINGARQFKSNISIVGEWVGTIPNRTLNITLIGITLTTTQKNTINNALTTKFGSGKVVLV